MTADSLPTTRSHPGLIGRAIYLDYNATTPVDPAVVEAMLPYLSVHFGNPASTHAYGTAAREAVTTARAQLADLIGAPADTIVFTGSGSEANNLALAGIDAARVITQTTEHPAVLATCRFLADAGRAVIHRLTPDGDGIVQPDALAAALTTGPTTLVSIMHANNETGVVQPIAELAAVAHAGGALFHTDAAQSIGKLDVDVDALGVDLLTVAGHKLYAPKGVGALYIRPGTPVAPLIHGGGQENGKRSGTENVALIVALGAAAQLAHHGITVEPGRQRQLRDQLLHRLRQHLGNRVHLNGHPEHRLPNTLNISIDGTDGADLLAATPDIAASTGSACHAGTNTPSPVLTAMGVTDVRARGAVRLSVGRYTTADDINRAADLLAARVGQLTTGPR